MSKLIRTSRKGKAIRKHALTTCCDGAITMAESQLAAHLGKVRFYAADPYAYEVTHKRSYQFMHGDFYRLSQQVKQARLLRLERQTTALFYTPKPYCTNDHLCKCPGCNGNGDS
jgi:hypothetical protein